MKDIDWRNASYKERCTHVLKQVYLYHVTQDPDIGSSELDELVCNELAHLMGDDEFQTWIEEPS